MEGRFEHGGGTNRQTTVFPRQLTEARPHEDRAMIYALATNTTPVAERVQIAHAIAGNDHTTLERFAQRNVVEHILQVASIRSRLGDRITDQTHYCVWCLDRVIPSRTNGPRNAKVKAVWFFRHTTNNACLGHQRAIGANLFLNPKHHGCYVCMGCEQVPGRDRRSCQCIDAGQTYCHYARTQTPPCV